MKEVEVKGSNLGKGKKLTTNILPFAYKKKKEEEDTRSVWDYQMRCFIEVAEWLIIDL